MVERLNFYDVYAYLLLGLVWLMLVVLPYCVVTGSWPSEALLSALGSVVAGYVLGHVLYQASRGVPTFDVVRAGRLDSQVLLDSDNKSFSDPMKARIRSRAAELFRIELSSDNKEADAVRQDVFQMARALLGRRKQTLYAEQFQGMYALSRGLAASSFVSAAYFLGFGAWGLLRHHQAWMWLAAGVLLMLVVGCVIWRVTRGAAWFAFVVATMAVLGAMLASKAGAGGWLMILLGGAIAIVGMMFIPVQRRFQQAFAKAVWEGLA